MTYQLRNKKEPTFDSVNSDLELCKEPKTLICGARPSRWLGD